MSQTDIGLLFRHIKKLYRAFVLMTIAVTVLEFSLMIRGFLIFDLSRQKHLLYLLSYIVLFLVSLVASITLLICRRKEKHARKLAIMTYLYAAGFILWAALVSALDIIARGDSMAMVFTIVIMAVGALMLIKPLFFGSVLGVSSLCLLGLAHFMGKEPLSPGFYINFLILLAVALFVNYHNYQLNRRLYESEQILEKLSYTDRLTGVYNRRSLDNHIEALIARGDSYGLMLIDVDNFKAVNDTYGHLCGDECLSLIASHLSEQFADGVYRFGGDEFAVILPAEGIDPVARMAEIGQRLKALDKEPILHLSAGFYRTGGGESAVTVFSRADKALYAAKAGGKDQCREWQED